MKDNCRKLTLAATTNTSCSTACPHTHGHSHTQPHSQLYTLDMRILLCTERVRQSPLSPLCIQYHPYCPHMYPVTHTRLDTQPMLCLSLSLSHTYIHTHAHVILPYRVSKDTSSFSSTYVPKCRAWAPTLVVSCWRHVLHNQPAHLQSESPRSPSLS